MANNMDAGINILTVLVCRFRNKINNIFAIQQYLTLFRDWIKSPVALDMLKPNKGNKIFPNKQPVSRYNAFIPLSLQQLIYIHSNNNIVL